jgi:hypothetical protein
LHAQQVAKAMKAINGLTVAAADCDANKQIGAAFNLKGTQSSVFYKLLRKMSFVSPHTRT